MCQAGGHKLQLDDDALFVKATERLDRNRGRTRLRGSALKELGTSRNDSNGGAADRPSAGCTCQQGSTIDLPDASARRDETASAGRGLRHVHTWRADRQGYPYSPSRRESGMRKCFRQSRALSKPELLVWLRCPSWEVNSTFQVPVS
jgi:hypothetical protein